MIQPVTLKIRLFYSSCHFSERTCFEISVKSLRLINGESTENWKEYCSIFVAFMLFSHHTSVYLKCHQNIFHLHYRRKMSVIRSEHNAELITLKTDVMSELNDKCTVQDFSYNYIQPPLKKGGKPFKHK